MSRPATSTSRPSHIALPTSPFISRSPNGSPQPLPQATSPTSPRNSFLPSFMRTRSRAATVTTRGGGAVSPSAEIGNPMASGTLTGTRRLNGPPPVTARDGGGVTRSVSTPSGLVNGSGHASRPSINSSTLPNPSLNPLAPPSKTYRIRLVPHLESSRSLAFDPVIREVMPISVPDGISPSVAAASVTSVGPAVNGRAPALLLRIGRFTDKSQPPPGTAAQDASNGPGASTSTSNGNGSGTGDAAAGGAGAVAGMGPSITIAGGGGDLCSGKVAFKSKVVSRSHAEIWCEEGGKFFIKDTCSSSGTFLNHIRLSSPNTDSRCTPINDGDILQLGVDYQGGHEDMFRCVKIRVEIGREWQRGANEFNTNALKQLKALGGAADPKGKSVESTPMKKYKGSVTDCCICLFSVTVCQSLFIAPCSHVFHYKCIRPLLMLHHPGFSCPLCRTFANLEEDVETEDAWEIASRRASIISRRPSNHSIRLPPSSDAAPVPPGSQAPEGPPSSGIGFGAAAASVDELLAGGNTSGGGESGTASDEGHTGENGDLLVERGRTAAPPREDDVDMGFNEDDPDLAGSLSIINNRSLDIPTLGGVEYRPDPFDDPTTNLRELGGMGEDVQTPMNDTFLATLAPGMQQRLDLARQMGEVGLRNEAVRESGEPEAEVDEGEDSRSREEEERRENVGMMFS